MSESVGRMESWAENFHFRYTIFWPLSLLHPPFLLSPPLVPLFSRHARISLSRNCSSRAAAYIEKGVMKLGPV